MVLSDGTTDISGEIAKVKLLIKSAKDLTIYYGEETWVGGDFLVSRTDCLRCGINHEGIEVNKSLHPFPLILSGHLLSDLVCTVCRKHVEYEAEDVTGMVKREWPWER